MAEAAFGMQLREYRKAAGLSLRQLAVRIGYDHSYLSQVERGQRPGSADLARLCDRELGTGNQLSSRYERTQARAVPAAQSSRSVRATAQIDSTVVPTDTRLDTGIAGVEPIEAAWLGLFSGIGGFDVVDESDAVLVSLEWRSVPPAELLPELVTEIQMLRVCASGRAEAAVRAVQLSVLVAMTLTALGQLRRARRWWQAARATGDRSGGLWVRSLVRAREVASGLVERRPFPELLAMADEAVELSRRDASRPGCAAQAHAARAQVLAELGQSAEAHRALQELLSVADQLPLASAPVPDWTAYDVHSAEGRVCARLGYGEAGCVLLGRALELCPAEWVGERAGTEMGLAECLVVNGEVAAGVALALRVLVELPKEWHSYYLYDAGERVLSGVREKEPGFAAARDLQELLARREYLGGRSVGSGSRYGVGRE